MSMSQRILFVDGWEFRKFAVGSEDAKALAEAHGWTSVDLPHDWLIYDVKNLYADADGWYRKTFMVTEDLSARRLSFRFEGVYQDSAVYINGRQAFEWKNGYTTFEFEATPYLRAGENEIALRVRHQAPNSRWYSGAGIYRRVWLINSPTARIAADGVYAHAQKEGAAWRLTVQTEIDGSIGGQALVRQTLRDALGNIKAEGSSPLNGQEASLEMEILDPQLWDVEGPALYRLETELLQDGEIIDAEAENIGFKEMAFSPNEGFFLNGRHLKLRGVCQHHDLGCLGAAVNKAALRRQFEILKAMGVNAIRSSHNVPAVEFIDLADELGLLVLTEAFDMWERPKTQFDYARFFPEWAERDVKSWVRRDRNRASLLMWSIGNEIYDTHSGPRGAEVTQKLMAWVKEHDPLGNAPVTIGSNYMPWEGAQNCADIVKLAGYNYGEKYYAEHHARHPDWIIYGSETASLVQSRGVYHFPAAQSTLSDDDEQCSALGNSATSWGAKSYDALIAGDRDAPYSLGQFLWSGFDYIGEPTPYFTKNSYFGQIDTAGFPKDSYYIYQAEWTNYRKAPMVHVFPYWDFNPGQLIDVRVCSNAPVVELFQDGKSLGKQEIDHLRGTEFLAKWAIPYACGVLEARAYDEGGKVIAIDRAESFSDAVSLELRPNKTTLAANGVDLAFIEISVKDERGRAVQNANNRVSVKVSGAGRLIGLDNGDSADADQYKGTSRRLFSGKLLAVVASTGKPGAIQIEVSSVGLKPAALRLESLKADCALSQATEENAQSPASNEVPVRKIELLSPSGKALGPDLREMEIAARLYPANATYQEVLWRVTNDAGIESNLARVKADGLRATVTALGDGSFRLRCSTKNGAVKIRLISQTEFSVSGLGAATLDPYGFVSGGLRTRGRGELGNGNDRGVSTPRDGESWVCFDGLDFGDYGSDEIAVPLFVLDGDPFAFEIWEKMEGDEGAECLGQYTYQKPSVWNTYQPESFKLKRRLKGVTSLSFRCRRKAHIKGFSFTRYEKAFQTLSALDNTRVYGDSYRLTPESIQGIGNNVSIVYENMDFGAKGCRKATICGRTPLERNTIHLRFDGPDGEVKQIAEFEGAADWTEREFRLEPVYGKQTFTLVFLPGSSFDLKWIRFE
jgi:beta-galactosidase